MNQKERINVTLTKRVKRRLQQIAEDKGVTMNDIVTRAINDYLDRLDGSYSAPDIVADRLGQILMTQIAMAQKLDQVDMKVSEHFD